MTTALTLCCSLQVEWMFSQPASLELTHNWGTESDAEFKGYHSGNDDPKGYGALQFTLVTKESIMLLDHNS